MSDTILYRFYGARNKLLYVGITNNFPQRMLEHSQKHWWPQVRATTTDTYPDRASAAQAETQAITSEFPMYNRAGNTFQPIKSVQNLGTIKEAAALVGVSTVTIRRWLSDGQIDGARFGSRSIRVDLDSLLTMQEPINVWKWKNEMRGNAVEG